MNMAKKAKAKKANGKARKSNGHANGNSQMQHLGKEGTITRFFQDRILAGDDNATVLKAAVKKFAKAKISKGYPSWYRSQLKRDGMLSA
jgi:hypothetical protein